MTTEHPDWFEDTGKTVQVDGKDRPVMKAPEGGRLFAGDDLCKLNPSGAPGRVWSAKSVEALQATINMSLRLLRYGAP